MSGMAAIREHRVIVLTGCTASGKGAIARALAPQLDAEILSVDSMKIYRGMDIGTAKPPPAERAAIRHHLIDVADPWQSFSAARFVELADEAIEAAHARGRPVLAVGGTVLYFKCFYEGMFDGPGADNAVRTEIRARAAEIGLDALHEELARIDPEAAARIHRNDLRRIERALEVHQLTGEPISRLQQQWAPGSIRRPEWRWTLIGLRREREAASRRINERVRRMVAAGLVDEARRIFDDPRGVGPQASQAVGYRELFEHFRGERTLEAAFERIKINSRHLAKSQRTWLKRQAALRWIDIGELDDLDSVIARVSEVIAADAQPAK